MSAGNEARRRRYRTTKAARVVGRKLQGEAEQVRLTGIEDERERWAEHDACFTPEAVVEQGLVELRDRGGIVRNGARILDPCAGAGIFGKVARRVLEAPRLIAFEPRDEEKQFLAQWYHGFLIATAQEGALRCKEQFDLIITNPPWWCWVEIFDAVAPLLAPGGIICLLGPSTWGHSDESSEGVELFDRWSPLQQLRIRGRIAFNGGSSTDNRKCSFWVWHEDARISNSWMTKTLPVLPQEARRWRVRPGTE